MSVVLIRGIAPKKMDEVRLDLPPAGGRSGCRGGQATVMLRES
jgi:hypothetical protein